MEATENDHGDDKESFVLLEPYFIFFLKRLLSKVTTNSGRLHAITDKSTLFSKEDNYRMKSRCNSSHFSNTFVKSKAVEGALLREVSLPNHLANLKSVRECINFGINPNISTSASISSKDKGIVSNIERFDNPRIDENKVNRRLNYQRSNGNRPLHYAAMKGDAALLKLLLLAGADPLLANCNGQTPLMMACRGSKDGSDKWYRQIITTFKNSIIGMRKQKKPRKSYPECVQSLLETVRNRSDLEVKDKSGGTALAQAILGSNVRAVKLLLQRGVDLAWERNSIASWYLAESHNINHKQKYKGKVPIALSLARSVWAMNAGIEVAKAEESLSRLKSGKGYSKSQLWEKISKKRYHSSSYTVIRLLERSLADNGRLNC